MIPSVRLRLSAAGPPADVQSYDERPVDLGPGSIIGRTPSAALRLSDPRVSEAHALVSLRGRHLKLLSLRGRLRVEGETVAEVILSEGLRIELAPGVVVVVVAVSLPSSVLALRGDRMPRNILPSVCSLVAGQDDPVPGFVAGAGAVLWAEGIGLMLRQPGVPDRTLAAGDTFFVDQRRFAVDEVLLEEAGARSTMRPADPEPLRIVLKYDAVHLYRDGLCHSLDGISARIISEIALMRAPVEWRTVAHEVWPDEHDDVALRKVWDAALHRLRRRLTQFGVRDDLLRMAGRGRVELFLGPRDRVQDET